MPATAPPCACCRWRWRPWVSDGRGGQGSGSRPGARDPQQPGVGRRHRVPGACRAGCAPRRRFARRLSAAYPALREAQPRFAYPRRRRENPSGWVVETMQAVLQSLLSDRQFRELPGGCGESRRRCGHHRCHRRHAGRGALRSRCAAGALAALLTPCRGMLRAAGIAIGRWFCRTGAGEWHRPGWTEGLRSARYDRKEAARQFSDS